MSVTIVLSEEMAARLRTQAQAQQLSIEQWALTILGQASENPNEFEAWARLNRRRFALIRRRYTGGLDEAEERELAGLQSAVATVLSPWDQELSEHLRPFESLAAQASRANGQSVND